MAFLEKWSGRRDVTFIVTGAHFHAMRRAHLVRAYARQHRLKAFIDETNKLLPAAVVATAIGALIAG